MQKPTIGRIVHYSHGGERLAAIITKVYSDGRVGLTAHPHGWGMAFDVAASPFVEEPYPLDPDPNKILLPTGTCCWPTRV